jgi:hypothetical protein
MMCTLVSYDILSGWCITFGIRTYNHWIWFKMSHLGIFAKTFFWEVSYNEILVSLRRHSEVPMVKISSFGSLYSWKYTLWKLGFLISPKTSLKQGFLENQSYIKLTKSKLSANTSIGKKTKLSISGLNFRS